MRSFLEKLSLRVLLFALGLSIVAFYLTKQYYYPHIPAPVTVDSALLDELKPDVVINIDSCNYYIQRSLDLYQEGDFKGSLSAANRAISFNGLSEYAENNKCAALIALGRLEEALLACERAVFLAPKFQNALGNTNYIKAQLAQTPVTQ